ncbi:DUF1330 domain-containing protein [Reyranella sp. CPCC 100927]|uniref:DUF1330 domain-containing protein n=1 Tax=Reyranella sp. CPCC 100927 TaxID=2599616 RepID=UPI0011B58904|nr:DUF1330 domain-containing protein [Reyranella sp. CPCC 100927]TWT08765.1 DUF1330 domain-containing protein [Reyranella sp. CPCC 100927]
MPAYFVIELDVADGPKLAEYEREVTEHVVAAGGRFIVRGNNYKPIEGDWHPKRIVIVEFPDVAAIERYYHSEANQRLKRTRVAGTGGAPAKAIAIEGLAAAGAPAAGKAPPREAGVDATGAVIWR